MMMELREAFAEIPRDMQRVWIKQASPSRTRGIISPADLLEFTAKGGGARIVRKYALLYAMAADLFVRAYQEAKWQIRLHRYRTNRKGASNGQKAQARQ